MARLVSSSVAGDMSYAAERIRSGFLVGFPTETVYGLGANALNADAVKNVFVVKGRPSTDPLIVHVEDAEAAFATLWTVDKETLEIARMLAAKFWPGPLTMVATAAACLPVEVTGSSGFVGLRVPNHPVALQLIRESGCPIAAPSANVFGHVSPTTAAHVMADLASRDPQLTVIEGGSCAIGIESTVVKLLGNRQLEVIRRGKVSADDLVAALKESEKFEPVSVTIRDTRSKFLKQDHSAAMDGPGQLLTHYAPHVPTYLLTPASLGKHAEGLNAGWMLQLSTGDSVPANQVVVLDVGGYLTVLQSQSLAYRSLSSSGDADEACRAVFDALRWSETVQGARALVIPLITEFYSEGQLAAAAIELLEAVEDRLFRAASGRVATVIKS